MHLSTRFSCPPDLRRPGACDLGSIWFPRPEIDLDRVDPGMQCAAFARCRPTWSEPLANAVPWSPSARGMLVVVPHPDDEAVMFGGLLSLAARRGIPIRLLAVTDGGAAYPGRIAADRLTELRQAEQEAAIVELGAAASSVTRIGLPDGQVERHEAELREAIVGELGDGIDLLVAPWKHDHHTDHEACGRAAEWAAQVVDRPISTAFGLFWALLREDPPAGISVASIEMTTWEMDHKRSAVGRHLSQVSTLVTDQPVLGATELAITRWSREHYIVATS